MSANMCIFRRSVVCALALLLSFASASLFAVGTGSIKGRVADRATGNPLPGASVVIVNSSLGSATNLDGSYTIPVVPTGTWTLKVTYIGYEPSTVQVTVGEDSVVVRDFRLTPHAVAGQEVIVTAQARGQQEAINRQLSSNSIINVVSAEKMKELPDANIAESIGRLPGISLERNAGEAYAVVVRGLSPQYNEVSIEGIPMSSTNYYDRSVDLSLLSDDLVKGVEVSKTLRADMDANALGGAVNLTLKSAQPGLHYGITGYGAYNNLRNTYNNYKFSGSIGDRFFDDQVGVLLQGNLEQKQLPSDQFSASYGSPVFSSAAQAFSVSTTSATLTEGSTNRHRFGGSLIMDYTSDLVDVKLFNVYDQKNDSNITRQFVTSFASNSWNQNIYVNETKTYQQMHSLQVLFKIEGTELPISLSYSRSHMAVPNGQEFDFRGNGVGTPISSSALIYGVPLDLIHTQGVMDPNDQANSVLNNMYINYAGLVDKSYDARLDWKVPFKLTDDLSGKLLIGGKYHYMDRTNSNYRINDYIQYGAGAGNRIDLANSFPYLAGINTTLQSGLPAYPWIDKSYTRKSILGYPVGGGVNIYQLVNMQNYYYYTLNKTTGRYWTDGPSDFNQDYTDKEKTVAGYVQGELNILGDFTIIPGVRYQDERTDISAYHVYLNSSNQNGLAGQAPALVESKLDNPYWYPSVNIKCKVTDNIQILGAVYKSVSLPSFGEINPLVEYQSGGGIGLVTANPLLKPSTAWNYDLGACVFSNDVGLFSVNLFYKEISNLIYYMQNYQPFQPYLVTGTPSDISSRLPGKAYYDTLWAQNNGGANLLQVGIPMNDPDKAFLRGIEFSWQTHLWYLPWVFNGLVLDLNASFMSSNQMYPYFQQVRVGGSALRPVYNLVYKTTSGKLQNQPKAIYNAILGWDYMGFSSRFSLRYQQATLTSIDTQYELENNYYDNVLLFDISLKQQLIYNIAIFANATNVNGHIDNYYFSHPAYQAYAAGRLPTSGQTYGWAIQLGLSFNY